MLKIVKGVKSSRIDSILLSRYQECFMLNFSFARHQSQDIFSTAQNVFGNAINEQTNVPSLANINSKLSLNQNRPPTSFELEQPGLIDASADISNILPLEPTLNALGEPSLASYGLGNFTPPGFVQHILEYLHADVGLPWWGSIVAATCIFRFVLFPIMIKSQKYSIKMGNTMPTIQRYQTEIFQARKMGDTQEVLRYSLLLRKTMLENDIKPVRSIMLPMAQLPVFVSFFLGLRAMASAPIESMKSGGFLWFPDLTISDPYYLLPLITSCTLLLTLELGAESGFRTQSMPYLKYVLRAMPVVVFFFSLKFQAALLCYWCTSNFVSLVQVGILRLPGVRAYFGIERIKPAPPSNDQKSLKMKFRDSWENQKMMSEIEQRIKLDAYNFRQAGMGPIPKTYSVDPTISLNNTKSKGQNKEPLMVGTYVKNEKIHEQPPNYEQRNLERIRETIRKRN